MNYTTHRSNKEATASQKMRASTHCLRGRSAGGAPLTSYKKIVDKQESSLSKFHKIRHYGLSRSDLVSANYKLGKQEEFLKKSYLYDQINQKRIPLIDLALSANHAPKRFYGEIQNRINTMQRIAQERDLKPIFMTLTLPSEYHPYTTLKNAKRIANPKYNGMEPKEAVKALTKLFAKLRQDRSLKELTKEQRLYFRVNEPHKSGVPHTHILMFVPEDRIERVKRAYRRLYDQRANDIQSVESDIRNSVAYVMKYINKILPLSKKKKLSEKEEFLNAWYVKHRIVRFNASKSMAPLYLYRMLHKHYTLYALTKLKHENEFRFFVSLDEKTIIKIIDSFGEVLYTKSDNYDLCLKGDHLCDSQTSESAIGMLS
ncbi:MAG: replication endonuclease [Campylobacterota bacterium]|nr:replication endonuclease [Campylobacterota bacterium]